MTDDQQTETDTSEITQSDISLGPETPVYGDGDVRVGIDDDGSGYVTLYDPGSLSYPYKLSVPADEIEAFAAALSAHGQDPPEPPADTLDDVSVPDGWTGGDVVHTGGGIWLRSFTRELDTGHRIEVVYDPNSPTGASAGLYDDSDNWLGEVDYLQTPSGLSPDAENAQQEALRQAYELMDRITDGEYQSKISQLQD